MSLTVTGVGCITGLNHYTDGLLICTMCMQCMVCIVQTGMHCDAGMQVQLHVQVVGVLIVIPKSFKETTTVPQLLPDKSNNKNNNNIVSVIYKTEEILRNEKDIDFCCCLSAS